MSAILHNSGRFKSHGRRGWTLFPDVPDEDELAAEPPEEQEAEFV